MNRRGVLSLALAGLAAVTGCSSMPATGPRTPPTPGETPEPSDDGGESAMLVSDLSVAEAEDGHLQVVATVTNRSEAERTRTLRIRVTVDGTTTERSREVTVPANDDREVTLAFESVAYDDFSGGGSLNSQLI